jgi:hydrogenase nickel incorporation protein HypA/HybF
VHERALMTDLLREIEAVARADEATRVTRVAVRLGALSHFTPEHFREHFVDASRGTLAEGAEVDAVLEQELDTPNADGVILESVEVEVPAPAESPTEEVGAT